MSRLIDADELCKLIEKEFDGVCVYDVEPFVAVNDFQRIVDLAPTVDAEPIRHGRWIYIDDGDERYATYRCSHCHKEVTVDAERICDIGFVIEDFERCLCCGSKMDLKDEVTE